MVGNGPGAHSMWACGGSSLQGATSTVELQLANSCRYTEHSEKHIIVPGVICVLVLVYLILVVWDAHLLQVCVFSLGTDGLLHVKNQLKSEAGNHLQKYT